MISTYCLHVFGQLGLNVVFLFFIDGLPEKRNCINNWLVEAGLG